MKYETKKEALNAIMKIPFLISVARLQLISLIITLLSPLIVIWYDKFLFAKIGLTALLFTLFFSIVYNTIVNVAKTMIEKHYPKN